MSTYTGPGIYRFTPKSAPNSCMAVSGGGKVQATPVVLWEYYANGLNMKWEIVAAGGTDGKPEVGDREYHILCMESGLMLCLGGNSSGWGQCLQDSANVRADKQCRWKISPSTVEGYYTFTSAVSGNYCLSTWGISTENGTKIGPYAYTDQDHFKWKLTAV